jgi:hypothetical protein
MAEHEDRSQDENWGASVGKWTFILTVVLAALYVGAVVVYVR